MEKIMLTVPSRISANLKVWKNDRELVTRVPGTALPSLKSAGTLSSVESFDSFEKVEGNGDVASILYNESELNRHIASTREARPQLTTGAGPVSRGAEGNPAGHPGSGPISTIAAAARTAEIAELKSDPKA